MNIGEVADWVDISPSSVRKYLRDFGDIEGCFSQSALPDQGKHRLFTDRDVAVIAWIAMQFRKYNFKTPDVRTNLIQRLETDEEFELPPRPEEEEALSLIPIEYHEEVLAAKQQALERALAERNTLMEIVEKNRQAHTGEIIQLTQNHAQEIARLNREIGRLAQLVKQMGGDPETD
jgi:DNA-binding transcriptional MerR regulator